MSAYEERRGQLYDWLAREGSAMAFFEDAEGRRDPTVRWLTGHPADALLFLTADRKSLLVPWDINMAHAYAHADIILPYSEFERRPGAALRGAAEKLKIPFGSKIEIPSLTPYPVFLNYVGTITDFDVICREHGAGEAAEKLRAS
jgi:Xaa-Pro dipeptidase